MKKLFSLLIVLILCIGCNLFVSGSLAETGNVMMELSDQQRNSIGVLFMEQGKSGSSNYKELIRQLQKISSDIVNESRKTPHKEELLAIDQKYSEEIEKVLAKYVPDLLQVQPWFASVFPPEWRSSVFE